VTAIRCFSIEPWLLAAFRPYGPFPILILQGPPGTGKTMAARFLRTLVDNSLE
jgi:AAA+ superfamily predicted ATPase